MKLATFLTACFPWLHAEPRTKQPEGDSGLVTGAAAGRKVPTNSSRRSARERAAVVHRWQREMYTAGPQLPQQLASAAPYFPGLSHLLSTINGFNGKGNASDATPQQLATYFGLIASRPAGDAPYSWKSFLNDCTYWGIESVQKEVQVQAGYDSPNVRRFMHWINHVEPCIDALINGVQFPPELADGFAEAAEYFPGLHSLAGARDHFDWTGITATRQQLAAYFGMIASTPSKHGSYTWESFLEDCTIYGLEGIEKIVRQQAGGDSPEVRRLVHWENDVLPYIGKAIQQWSARVSQDSGSSDQPAQGFPQLRSHPNSNRDDGMSSQGSDVASSGKTKRGSWGWGGASSANGSSARGEGRRLKRRPRESMDEQGGPVTSSGKTKRGPRGWGETSNPNRSSARREGRRLKRWPREPMDEQGGPVTSSGKTKRGSREWGETNSMSEASVSAGSQHFNEELAAPMHEQRGSRNLDAESPGVSQRPGSNAQLAQSSYLPRPRRNSSEDGSASPRGEREGHASKTTSGPLAWGETNSMSEASVSAAGQRFDRELAAPMHEQRGSAGYAAGDNYGSWRASANRVKQKWPYLSRPPAAPVESRPTVASRARSVVARAWPYYRADRPTDETTTRTIPYTELNRRENQNDIAELRREGEDSNNLLMINKAKTLAWSSRLFNTAMRDTEFANRELVLTQKSGAGILSKRLDPNTWRLKVERTGELIICAALENGAQVVNAANEYIGGGLLLRDPGDGRNRPGRRGGKGWVWEEQMFATLGLDKLIPKLRNNPMGKTRRTRFTSTNDADITPVLIKNASPLFSIDKETALLTARDQGRRDDNMYTNARFDPASTFGVAGDTQKTVDVACIAAPELEDDERGMPYKQSTVRDMVASCATIAELLDRSKTLHSGPLGAGAFKHSYEMSFASQMLAFGSIALPVKFWGVEGAYVPAYNEALTVVRDILREAQGKSVTLEELADQLWQESVRRGWTTQP